MKYAQVRKLDSIELFRAHLESIGVTMPLEAAVDADIDPAGPLARPIEIHDASAGVMRAPNRFAVLPMEGWDGDTHGRPTDLVRRRWQRFAASGCGLVWGEATAVRPDGRANPNQLVIDDTTVDDIAALRGLLAPDQIAGMQLTHSGRWARPHGTPAPRTAYEHPLLDARVGASAAIVFRDDELDELVGQYVAAAVLARQAGFDFVDIKHCHGYLLHELLSAYDRPGRYGGDLAGRTAFLRAVVEGIRSHVPDLAIAVRLSLFDFVPYMAGDHGVGAPAAGAPYRHAFGGDGSGSGIDLSETHALLQIVEDLGIGLVSATAGSPYYNPHIQRPAFIPPSDGYDPPEDPLAGVGRQIAATAEVARAHPAIAFVGSGYSYLQEWLPNVGQAVVAAGGAAMIGLGRMMLAYPELPADVLAGRPLRTASVCRTFSDCTTAPRNGLVSGCYPLDDFYRERPELAELTVFKKQIKARRAAQ